VPLCDLRQILLTKKLQYGEPTGEGPTSVWS
jgi:hypothetical protein